MEEFVRLFAEYGLVAGAFIYMLYLFLNKFGATQERISDTLIDVSNTMRNIDSRLEHMDKRITRLEQGKNYYEE